MALPPLPALLFGGCFGSPDTGRAITETGVVVRGPCFVGPVMTLSPTTVEFGDVAEGEEASATVTVANAERDEAGEPVVLTLGIGAESEDEPGIEIGERALGEFQVSWDVAEITCAGAEERHRGRGGDSGIGHDDSGRSFGDTGAVGAPELEFTLPPGCSIPLTVTHRGTGLAESAALLHVRSVQSPEASSDAFAHRLPAYLSDWPDPVQEVLLHATDPTASRAENTDPVVIGLQTTPDRCHEGDTVTVTATAIDPDGQDLTYSWGDDKNTAGFADVVQASTTWTCPEVEGCISGARYTVYALCTDEDGHQDWGQTKVDVFTDDVPFDFCYASYGSEGDSGDDSGDLADGCGCKGCDDGAGEDTGASPAECALALIATSAALWRRRNQPAVETGSRSGAAPGFWTQRMARQSGAGLSS